MSSSLAGGRAEVRGELQHPGSSEACAERDGLLALPLGTSYAPKAGVICSMPVRSESLEGNSGHPVCATRTFLAIQFRSHGHAGHQLRWPALRLHLPGAVCVFVPGPGEIRCSGPSILPCGQQGPPGGPQTLLTASQGSFLPQKLGPRKLSLLSMPADWRIQQSLPCSLILLSI